MFHPKTCPRFSLESMPTQRSSVPRPVVTAIVAALLALHAWLAVSATIDLGVTADETAHLTGGYSYWRFNDYRLQPENGNLPQRWAALPLLEMQPHLQPHEQQDEWSRSHVWLIAQRFFFESGNSTEYMLLWARTAMIAWSVATAGLVFLWSRRLWGEAAAVFSLALYSFSPTTLAHGPLVTSDMCATFWLLAATGAWWRLLQRVDRGTLLISLLAASGAAVAKFSCVLLLPTVALLTLWRLCRAEPLAIELGPRLRRISAGRLEQTGVLGLVVALHLLAAWVVVWACFGFRYSAFAPDLPQAVKFFAAWDAVVPNHGFWRTFFDFARSHHLLPEAYLQGFAYVLAAAQARGAFLAGQFGSTGWWWFFPYAFAVKSSLTELVVALAVSVFAVRTFVRSERDRMLRHLTPVAPLVVFAIVYGGFSLASHLNIGHRHILPLYPVLFIAAGALLRNRRHTVAAVAAVSLVALGAVEVVAVRPHYLTYFNRIAGGPDSGWRHLVDSSLDWGQNLPRLSAWLKSHRAHDEPVYASIFGTDDAAYHGVDAEELSPYYSFGRHRRWSELKPGLYCIGATMLQDVYSPYAGPWTVEKEFTYRKLLRQMRAELADGRRSPELGEFGKGPEHLMWNLDRARFARLCLYLRERKPDAVVGHSILVFRLTAAEVAVVVDGSLTELTAMIAAARSGAQGN